MQTEDLRAEAILTWLKRDLGLAVLDRQPASSDASFRRYFRITLSNQTLIVMDAPPDREDIRPFIKVANMFRAAHLHVPEIFYTQHAQGFIALEDFGSVCYLEHLLQHPEDADRLYADAFNSLLTLQRESAGQTQPLPMYDSALLTRELGIFTEWFLGAYLHVAVPETLLAEVYQLLIATALEQPQTLVHRDFHSRNLMLLTADNPGIIDFQDAVIGPITYDLVSLLKDCYISWPEAQVAAWRDAYLQQLRQQSAITYDAVLFKRWFDLMGMQRHLKAIGIFSRLHLRDGKSTYLQDIPRTLAYVLVVCDAYPELHAFRVFLTNTVMPAYQSKL